MFKLTVRGKEVEVGQDWCASDTMLADGSTVLCGADDLIKLILSKKAFNEFKSHENVKLVSAGYYLYHVPTKEDRLVRLVERLEWVFEEVAGHEKKFNKAAKTFSEYAASSGYAEATRWKAGDVVKAEAVWQAANRFLVFSKDKAILSQLPVMVGYVANGVKESTYDLTRYVGSSQSTCAYSNAVQGDAAVAVFEFYTDLLNQLNSIATSFNELS